MMTLITGRFWRSVFALDAPHVLAGARPPEGRYHHDSQPALYWSPTPEFSRSAIDAYLRAGDAPA